MTPSPDVEGRTLDRTLLTTYLSDHVAGATAMAGRVDRMANAYADTPLGEPLRSLAETLSDERAWLIGVAEDLGVDLSRWKSAATWVGEKVARLKLNGRVVSRSPLSALLELELFRAGLVGKRSGWLTLLEWSPELGLDRTRLSSLIADVEGQLDDVERLTVWTRRRALAARVS